MIDQPTQPAPQPPASPASLPAAAPPVGASGARSGQFRAACRIAWPLHRSGHYPRRFLAQLIDALVLLAAGLLAFAGTPYSPVVVHRGERGVAPFAHVPILDSVWCTWGPVDTSATADAATSAPPITLLRHRLANGTEVTWTVHPERRWPVALLSFLAYHTVLVAAFGQTLGKRLMRLRVVTRNGGRVGVLRALARAGLYLLAAASYAGVGWILVDRQRRGWHDLAGGTRVI